MVETYGERAARFVQNPHRPTSSISLCHRGVAGMGLPRRAAVTPEGVSRGSMGPVETQAAHAGHSLLKLSEFRRRQGLCRENRSHGTAGRARQPLRGCAPGARDRKVQKKREGTWVTLGAHTWVSFECPSRNIPVRHRATTCGSRPTPRCGAHAARAFLLRGRGWIWFFSSSRPCAS
jgi:hypothetical protein